MELCIALENDLQHEKQWKNIQRVIRSTLMSFLQVIKEQAQQIDDLKNQVEAIPNQINERLDTNIHKMDEKIESIKSQMNDLKETNLTHPSETQEVVDTMKDEIMEYLQGDFIKSIDETNQKTSNYIIAQVSEQTHEIKEEQTRLEKELKEYCTYESLNKALSFKANKEDQDELVVALEEKCSHEALEQASSLLKIELEKRIDAMPRREEYVEFVKVQNKTLEDKLFSSFHEISDALIERKKETEMVQNQIIQFREAILPEVIEEIENLQSQIRLFSLEEKQGIVTPSTPVVSSSSNCINCVLKETTTTATMTMIATKKEDQKEVINSSTMENEKPLENEVPVAFFNAQISHLQKDLHTTELRIMKNMADMKQDVIHLMNERFSHINSSDLEKIHQAMEKKADIKDLIIQKRQMQDVVALVESWQFDFDQLKHEILKNKKNNSSSSLSRKNINKINNNTLNNKEQLIELIQTFHFATQEEVEQILIQVKMIQKQIKSEIYQARWIWTKGRPNMNTQTIHWNTQVVNTNANVFVWKKNTDFIMTMIPGLYQLQAGFFTNFTPIIQILVNGEPIFYYYSNEQVIKHNDNDELEEEKEEEEEKHKKKNRRNHSNESPLQGFQRLHHSGGNFAGISISCFLALPARSQVSITYDIDENAQGFLNLRKL